MDSIDIRSAIAGLVQAVHPFDDREAADQADILDWVASGRQLFRTTPPATPPKHLVVYFIPVDSREKCLLLGDHRKSGLWLPPGGHVEDGEDPRQAVIREAHEELGIRTTLEDDSEPLFLTVTPTVGPNSHLDVDLWFVLKLARHDAQLTPDPREFNGVRWFDFHEQHNWPTGTYDPEMSRFVAKLEAAVVRW